MVIRDITDITLTGIIDRIRTMATMQGLRSIGRAAIAIIATIVIIITIVTGNNEVILNPLRRLGIPSRLTFVGFVGHDRRCFGDPPSAA